ncbi:MAG: PLP-dependent transferase [Fimbriimonadales bacterium]|nr:PLP-dependent transferase [Fimbriimonadales bacterium]
MRFETIAIRVGQDPDPATGSVIVPIYATSTFRRQRVDQEEGYEYSRVANPTRAAAEQCLAALEGGKYCLLFASGMAAESAVIGLLKPGEHVVCIRDVYGGTMSLLRLAEGHGIHHTYVDATRLEEVERAIRPETRLLWLESPTNPPVMSHSSLTPEERAARGVTDNLVRLSVGLEHIDDLRDDLEQALAKV